MGPAGQRVEIQQTELLRPWQHFIESRKGAENIYNQVFGRVFDVDEGHLLQNGINGAQHLNGRKGAEIGCSQHDNPADLGGVAGQSGADHQSAHAVGHNVYFFGLLVLYSIGELLSQLHETLAPVVGMKIRVETGVPKGQLEFQIGKENHPQRG